MPPVSPALSDSVLALCAVATILSGALSAFVSSRTAAAVSRLETHVLELLRDYPTRAEAETAHGAIRAEIAACRDMHSQLRGKANA